VILSQQLIKIVPVLLWNHEKNLINRGHFRMKHLFSSGEILTHQNEKKLDDGMLIGDMLEYDSIQENMTFVCLGEMNEKRVEVHFSIDEEGFQLVGFRSRLGILMQSDIFESTWTNYKVSFV
jgi:hypothetical protein